MTGENTARKEGRFLLRSRGTGFNNPREGFPQPVTSEQNMRWTQNGAVRTRLRGELSQGADTQAGRPCGCPARCVRTRARVQDDQVRVRRGEALGDQRGRGAVQGFAGHCQNFGFHPEEYEKPLEKCEQRRDMICFIKGPL